MPRNEDYRKVWMRRGETVLDLEARYGPEVYVEDDTRRGVGVVRRQKFLRGRERGYGDSFRAQKPREGGAHRGVVIDDGDPGGPSGRNPLPYE